MVLILLAFGAIGHVILWVALINRVHALGIQRRWIDLLTIFCLVTIVLVPLAIAATFVSRMEHMATVGWGYIVLCTALSVFSAIQRWHWYRHPERHGALVANHTSHRSAIEQAELLTARGVPTWLSRLPYNEALTICVQEKELSIPRLSRENEGLRIAHITDLHMSGRLTRAYFEHVVEEVNRTEPDIVAITGDIVERDKCIDWIPTTLGRLRANYGVYYVLGNHDLLVDETQLKAALASAGIIHLGGAWCAVMVRGVPLILAGNELPWYKPAADLSNCPDHGADGLPLRILLAHSPDQFEWAQANDIDLVLAGHLHGGQVCLPLIGAITAPSVCGVRYSSGVFRNGNTVMHVSRGTGSLTPVRYNCPPEIAVLRLVSPRSVE